MPEGDNPQARTERAGDGFDRPSHWLFFALAFSIIVMIVMGRRAGVRLSGLFGAFSAALPAGQALSFYSGPDLACPSGWDALVALPASFLARPRGAAQLPFGYSGRRS